MGSAASPDRWTVVQSRLSLGIRGHSGLRPLGCPVLPAALPTTLKWAPTRRRQEAWFFTFPPASHRGPSRATATGQGTVGMVW